LGLIAEEQEQIDACQALLEGLTAERERHEFSLREIESALGASPQIRLDDASVLLRGQRIREVAVEVLEEEHGEDAEVHYKEWFQLLKRHGHIVAGKDPVNTFLTQINRSPAVGRVGSRTGRYRLLADAA
jgi:hypothetical protein